MKRLMVVLLMILSIGFINVNAADAITVPSCGVTVNSNLENDPNTYKATITAKTPDAPMPTLTELQLKSKEEKTFGTITYDAVGQYEYEISLEGETDKFVYTVVVIEENGVLEKTVFVKKNGTGNKLDKAVFTVVKEDITPTPTPTPKPTPKPTPSRTPISPNTADFIFKFLVTLIVSGIVIFLLVKTIKKDTDAQ